METSANSYILGATSTPKGWIHTPRSTGRSLWSPQQMMHSNCPKGMSEHTILCPCTTALGRYSIPSPLRGKQAASWLAGTISRVFFSALPHLCRKTMLHLPCDSQLKAVCHKHGGSRTGKKGQGKKQFSIQSSNFLKEESDL